jgi:hypothetical protein
MRMLHILGNLDPKPMTLMVWATDRCQKHTYIGNKYGFFLDGPVKPYTKTAKDERFRRQKKPKPILISH